MAQSLSNLPVGAQIKFGKHQVNTENPQPIIWTIVAKNHGGTYPVNSVTLLATKIIDFRCYDAKEPNNTSAERKSNGNNRYRYSNIHQWLNSNASPGNWYTAQHSADQIPSKAYVTNGTQYDARPGFLYWFSPGEYAAILDTTIRTDKAYVDGGGYEDFTAKVFLPSLTELGLGDLSGVRWEYFPFDDWEWTEAKVTDQAYNNSQSASKPQYIEWGWSYWTRTANTEYPNNVRAVSVAAAPNLTGCASGGIGVRPALNLPYTTTVSDTTDSSGCYTVSVNLPPDAPYALNVPISVRGGKTLEISWTDAWDPDDGLAVAYVLEANYSGKGFTQIFDSEDMSVTSYTDTIKYGETTVQYRVCAYDPNGARSDYTTSEIRSVINNDPPTISGTDGNLGVKSEGFSQTYTINDVDGGSITVTEAIDGVAIRSYIATLGSTNTFKVTDSTWLKQSNGSHTMTITATDQVGDTTVRTYTFAKSVDSFTVMNTTPYDSDVKPSRVKLSITRSIPAESTFTVYVCNNGYDASPTWEDATEAVVGGVAHAFTNNSKTAGMWGVSVKVVVARGAGEGPCYVSYIGGNFE
jgi:hypothetical protein